MIGVDLLGLYKNPYNKVYVIVVMAHVSITQNEQIFFILFFNKYYFYTIILVIVLPYKFALNERSLDSCKFHVPEYILKSINCFKILYVYGGEGVIDQLPRSDTRQPDFSG